MVMKVCVSLDANFEAHILTYGMCSVLYMPLGVKRIVLQPGSYV